MREKKSRSKGKLLNHSKEYIEAQLRSMHTIGPCFRVSIFEGLGDKAWPERRGNNWKDIARKRKTIA